MSRRRPLDLQRLRHVDGELLRSRDLRDELAGDLALQWWHQRAVHRAYGVTGGLVVSPPQDGVLTVAAGLAYDARGRELMLVSPASIVVPDGNDRLALVLCHRAVGAALAWVPAERVDPCGAVALAVLDRAVADAPQPVAARARTVARPRMAWGETPPEATPWQRWLLAHRLDGVQVAIDASAAGFTDVPVYFAWLQWPNLASAPADGAVEYAMLGVTNVQHETVGGFTFHVLVARAFRQLTGLSGGAGVGDPVTFARAQRLHVCWLGIQCDDAARGA
jgi:hypothetical protein